MRWLERFRLPRIDWTSERLPAATPEERAERARRAKALLADEVLAEALARLDEKAVAGWRRAASAEGREVHWNAVQAVEALRSELRGIMNEELINDRIHTGRR